MKIKISVIILAIMLVLTACGRIASVDEATSSGSDNNQSKENVQIANPWQDITEEAALKECPASFKVPDGAENAHWSILKSANSSSDVTSPLLQLTFEIDGKSFTAREQITGNKEIYNTGLYYNWTAEDDIIFGKEKYANLKGMYYRYIGQNEYVDLCTWYDSQAGVSYCVSIIAENLDGFDLQAIVDNLMP